MPLHFLGGQIQVAVARDIVTIKDRARLSPEICMAIFSGITGPHHVADGGAPEIVKEKADESGLLLGFSPGPDSG